MVAAVVGNMDMSSGPVELPYWCEKQNDWMIWPHIYKTEAPDPTLFMLISSLILHLLLSLQQLYMAYIVTNLFDIF